MPVVAELCAEAVRCIMTAWFGTAVVSGRDPSSSCYREVLTCLDRSARATTTVAEYELDPIDY